MKRTCILSIVSAGALALTGALAADEIGDLNKAVFDLNRAGRLGSPEKPLVDIARKTGVPVETLKTQKARYQLGHGELFIANALAAKTGKTFDEIIAERRAGKGWGKLAHENNLKLGPLVSELKQAHHATGAGGSSGHAGKAGGAGKGKEPKSVKEAKPDRPLPTPAGASGRGGGRGRR